MAARGERWFVAGSLGMIAAGVLHALGNLEGPPPEAAAAQQAMREFHVTVLGLTWSLHDAYLTLSLSYSLLSIWIGALGLALLAIFRPPERALSRLGAWFATAPALLLVIAFVFRIAPPLYVYTVVTALYATSALRARG